jgi:transglutaminase-like putative cysteine protease
VRPAQHSIHWQQDPQSNYLARLLFPQKATELSIEVEIIADMGVRNPFDFVLELYATHYPFEYTPEMRRDLGAYLILEPASLHFADYLASIPRMPRSLMDFLVALNQRLSREIRYLMRWEPGVQTPEQTLQAAAGSCRDSSWLLVQLLRHLGLAARFVSGYLIELSAGLPSLDGSPQPQSDSAALHAWCEVYLPGAGWIGLDPTSGLLTAEGHIALACTSEPGSAAPVSGSVEPSEVEFSHMLRVARS